jgi:hypothetical protein
MRPAASHRSPHGSGWEPQRIMAAVVLPRVPGTLPPPGCSISGLYRLVIPPPRRFAPRARAPRREQERVGAAKARITPLLPRRKKGGDALLGRMPPVAFFPPYSSLSADPRPAHRAGAAIVNAGPVFRSRFPGSPSTPRIIPRGVRSPQVINGRKSLFIFTCWLGRNASPPLALSSDIRSIKSCYRRYAFTPSA